MYFYVRYGVSGVDAREWCCWAEGQFWLDFLRHFHPDSTVASPVYTPTNSEVEFLHSHILPSTCHLFSETVTLTCVRRNTRVVFVYISVVIKGAEHFNKYLLVICTSPFENIYPSHKKGKKKYIYIYVSWSAGALFSL